MSSLGHVVLLYSEFIRFFSRLSVIVFAEYAGALWPSCGTWSTMPHQERRHPPVFAGLHSFLGMWHLLLDACSFSIPSFLSLPFLLYFLEYISIEPTTSTDLWPECSTNFSEFIDFISSIESGPHLCHISELHRYTDSARFFCRIFLKLGLCTIKSYFIHYYYLSIHARALSREGTDAFLVPHIKKPLPSVL